MRLIVLPIPLLLAAGPACAHAILIDSMPAPLAHVPAGHLDAILRYNSRIDAGRSKLTLTHGDDVTRLAADPAGKPDLLHASLALPPGDYVIKWQVLATDGHITHGTLPFTVDSRALPAKTAPAAGAR